MPLFDFQCHHCGHRFEDLVSSADVRPACPACGGTEPEKLPSAFAVGKGGATADLPEACRSCGDPRGPGGCGMGG